MADPSGAVFPLEAPASVGLRAALAAHPAAAALPEVPAPAVVAQDVFLDDLYTEGFAPSVLFYN